MKNHFFKTRLPAFSLLLIFAGFMNFSSTLFSQERFRRTPPSPDPLPALSLPGIETRMLANGLSMTLVPIPDLPVIHLALIVKAGEYLSPDSNPGLASFTTQLLATGSQSFPSGEISETIESIGGEFSTETQLEYSIFRFSFLADYLDTALEILSNMIIEPGFLSRDIETLKRSLFYDLISRKTSPDYTGKRLLYQILFKDHAAKKVVFSEDRIKNFSRESLIEFHDQHYIPNNAQLILIGDMDYQTASRKVSRFFSRWAKKDRPQYTFNPPKASSSIKICFIDIPQDPNATILIGNVLTPFQSEDIHPFSVFNRVLGETPNSRIFMNLRETRGYAYYAFSHLELFKNFGVYYIRAKVRPNVVSESIREIMNEIWAIQRAAIPALQIEQAKSSLIGNFPLKIMDLTGFADQIEKIIIYNLGNDHWNKYYENIMQVSSQDVFDLIKIYSLLTPVIIVAGNRDVLLEPLLSTFETVMIYDQNGNLIETDR